MVRVTIAAIRPESGGNMGPDAANVSGNLSLYLNRIRSIQIAIDVIQKVDAANAKFSGGCAKLGFTSLAHNAQLGPDGGVSKTAALTAGRRDEMRMNAFTRVFGEGSAHPERLVVGVRENAHQAKVVFHNMGK
jgi:hypothetical protein